jgi:hypothetical protein
MRPSTLHIPTDPNRVKVYGVTEKGTGNGWQGTSLLCKWPVHRPESHTKWATSRAPLTDKSGLGEIHLTCYHVIDRQLGRVRPSSDPLCLPLGNPGCLPPVLMGHPPKSTARLLLVGACGLVHYSPFLVKSSPLPPKSGPLNTCG